MKLVTDRKEIRYLQMPPQSEALRIHFKQFHVVEIVNESLNLSISYRGEVGSFGVSTTKGTHCPNIQGVLKTWCM